MISISRYLAGKFLPVLVSAVLVLTAGQQLVHAQDEDLNPAEREQVAEVNNLFRRAVSAILPAVVQIESTLKAEGSTPFYPRSGLGSGVIIDARGLIMTNNHVVANVDQVEVVLADGRRFRASEIMTDEDTDLAVVKIDPEGETLPFARFGDSDQAQVGDFVMAIGSPFGFDLKQTVTMGIISFKGRQNHILDKNWGLENFIQTDAEINPGSSGGPLVNLYGEIIGINSNIYSRTGVSMGYGFAIPSKQAQHVFRQLEQYGAVRRGWLGIKMGGLDDMRRNLERNRSIFPEEQAHEMLKKSEKLLAPFPGTLHGVLITEVIKDSPAEKQGLLRNDVILSVNGQDLTDAKDLQHVIAMLPPGEMAVCRIWRDGNEQTVEIELGDRLAAKAKYKEEEKSWIAKNQSPPLLNRLPDMLAPDEKIEFDDSDPPVLGVLASNLSPEIARQYGYHYNNDEAIEGVLIDTVIPDTLAEAYQLRPGDIIVAVNDEPIRSVNQLKRIVARVDLVHRGMALEIYNQAGKRTVTIRKTLRDEL